MGSTSRNYGKAKRRERKSLWLSFIIVANVVVLSSVCLALLMPSEFRTLLRAIGGEDSARAPVQNPVGSKLQENSPTRAFTEHPASQAQAQAQAQAEVQLAADVDVEADVQSSSGSDGFAAASEPPSTPLELGKSARYQTPQGVLVTEDGRRIEIGRIFEREQSAIERRLRAASQAGRLLRLNHAGTTQPSYLLSFRNTALHGPQASFYEDGQPTCLLDYRLGKRNSVLMTWDEQSRPFVFEQYEGGQKHGFRCLHKACSVDCKEGHLWLVEKWRHGVRESVHLVPENGTTRTYLCSAGNITDRVATIADDAEDAELGLALQELEKFEEAITANERQIVAQLERRQEDRLNQAMAMRRKAMELYVRNALSVRRCSGGG